MLRRPGEETEILTCPYNDVHQIMRCRFQVHLVRCRKSHPHAKVVTCPFNIVHRVNQQELDWHVSTCPNRQSFEVFKCNEAPVQGLSSSIGTSFCGDTTQRSIKIDSMQEVESPQSWDDGPDVPAYDPAAYVEKAPVLRMPVGMPPAKRVAFRNAERKRLQNIVRN